MESRPFVVVALSGVLSLLLAGTVAVQNRAANDTESDVLVRIFGGTAEIVSQRAVDEADLYLHAGVGHSCEDACESGVRRARTLPLQGLVCKFHDSTAPKDHKHIEGEEEKELLPWFVVAVRLDPHNVEAWLDGAYWHYRTGNHQEAERFISAGIRHNPDDHRVHLERGILYHRMSRWAEAARDLETSIRLYREINDESKFELRAARTFLRDTRQHLHEP